MLGKGKKSAVIEVSFQLKRREEAQRELRLSRKKKITQLRAGIRELGSESVTGQP